MSRQFFALSGLAIAIVVLNHAIGMGTAGIQELGFPVAEGWERVLLVALRGLGTFAVPTFLFASGSFVSYAARRRPPRLPWRSVWAAMKRLLCPYLIWSTVFYIYVYLRFADQYTLRGYITNLIVGYPFHFVPILVFYYVCSPVLVRLTGRFGYILLTGIVLCQLCLIAILFPSVLGLAVPDWTEVLVPPVLGRPMAQWGIYFPLGLVYSLKVKEVSPWLRKFRLVPVVVTAVFFVMLILDDMLIIHFPLAYYLCPVAFLFLASTIKRSSIPLVHQLEKVAKRSYGLYLTNLIVLDIAVFGAQVLLPGLIAHHLLFCLILFVLALLVPLGVMGAAARTPVRRVYSYVFG